MHIYVWTKLRLTWEPIWTKFSSAYYAGTSGEMRMTYFKVELEYPDVAIAFFVIVDLCFFDLSFKPQKR